MDRHSTLAGATAKSIGTLSPSASELALLEERVISLVDELENVRVRLRDANERAFGITSCCATGVSDVGNKLSARPTGVLPRISNLMASAAEAISEIRDSVSGLERVV